MSVFFFGLATMSAMLAIIYELISHKTFSRPINFVLLGFISCVLSSSTSMSFDVLVKIAGDQAHSLEYDFLKQTLSLSLASLGGTLIGAGFITKAAIKHATEEKTLKQQLTSLLKENTELQNAHINSQENNDKELAQLCIRLIIANKKEIREIEKELEIKDRVNAGNK